MLYAGWGCGGVGVLPLVGVFFCQVYLQHLERKLLIDDFDFLIRSESGLSAY
jgi:hypothetical protein